LIAFDQRVVGREVAVPDVGRVAVVDDDGAVREGLSALLRSAGFGVETFASAEEFLRSGQFSGCACLVLDIRLSGMSGVELQELLLDSGADLPIVLMTAHADSGVRARALSSGAVAVLQKPFSDEALLEAIELSLRRARP
jgi:two-component system, LuxR family, response regulator FixJ